MELYPKELWQLHKDLDDFAYGDHKSSELQKRLPAKLEDAEQLADDILIKFLQDIDINQYIEKAKETASEDAKKMYALRCFIASNTENTEPNKIEIYSNKLMTVSDFHDEIKELSDGSLAIIEPEDSEDKDSEDKDSENPYRRAFAHDISKTHTKIEEIQGKQLSQRDFLPEFFSEEAKRILINYDIEVTKENAWEFLDSISKKASIEDRIVGRILYLITNAAHVDFSSNTKQLLQNNNFTQKLR